MTEFANYFLTYLVAAMIMWFYCSQLFEPKCSLPKRILYITILYGINFGTAFFNNTTLNILVFIVINFLYLLFAFNISIKKALFNAFVLAITLGLGEVLVALLNKSFVYNVFEKNVETIYYMFLSMVSKLLYFVLLLLLIRSGKIGQKDSDSDVPAFMFIIPALSAVVMIFYGHICINFMLNSRQVIMLLICSSIMILINITVFIIYDYINRQNKKISDYELQFQKEKDQLNYFQYVKEQQESRKIIIHDYKKHLRTLSDLTYNGKIQEAENYIDELLGSPAFTPSRTVSDNILLNAILSRYLEACETKKIAFTIDVRSKTVDFLSDNDLTTIFYNLLDNAVESASNSAPNAFIDLRVNANEAGRVNIILKNSCANPPIITDDGKISSTKKSKRSLHGYGLMAVERSVKNYNGSVHFSFNKEEHCFSSVIIIFPTSTL